MQGSHSGRDGIIISRTLKTDFHVATGMSYELL